jgi:hypothetical protein
MNPSSIHVSIKQFNLCASLVTTCLVAWSSSMAAADVANSVEVHEGVFPFYPYAACYDILNFTPLDQGGRLIQLQVIGSERDADVIKAIRSPGFFAPWGNPIRWDSLEKTELEKSVWLNRWYFLPCLSRQYYLTHDRSCLDEALTFIRKWVDDNPVPPNLAEYFATRKYNWRDMQVAWRMQNLAWSYFLGKDGYTVEEKRELFELVKTHARVLLEYFGKQPFNKNNHQSHGASAMLYAALLFPDIPEAASLKERAFAILNHHLEQAFYEDGNSVELVPGYYPFFASIFRDAWMLCRANHVAPPPRSRERLKQFYHYMGTVVQPDGKMPPINDSTESDPSVSLHALADLLGLPYRAAGSHWFSASDQAVMRDKSAAVPAYAFLDAGQRVSAHWHGGKLGFHLWFWDTAFVIDSGIANYDNPLRRSWFNKPEAHNTILVDGKGDYDWAQFNEANRPMAGSTILHWESNRKYDWAVMQHTGFQNRSMPVSWLRHFILLKGFGVLLVDQLESQGEHDYTWLFHLLPSSPILNQDLKSVFTGFPEKNLLLLPADSRFLRGPSLGAGTMSRQGRILTNPVAKYEAHSANVLQAYLLLPVQGNQNPVAQLSQRSEGDTVTIYFAGTFGARRVNIVRSKVKGEYTLKVETAAPQKSAGRK